MKRLLAVCTLAFLLAGCSWIERQNIDVCLDWKGRHVCVGRKDGVWTVSGAVDKKDEDEVIASLGGN